MTDFEKLGLFYLGKICESKLSQKSEPFLYDSKHLTTHAMCVGMTGSGKTGLGIALMEEAGLDKIPCIAIDPKGDLTNLLLTFPHLTPEEFRSWVDPQEAERERMQVEEYAKRTALTWKKGLAEWGEDAKRIQKLRKSVDMAIYTPASGAGIPLSILSSFNAPSKEQLADTEFLRDRIVSITTGLLGLVGMDADPLKSPAYILISTIMKTAWEKGDNLDIESLIRQVQKPPFSKIGALDVETFFPQKEREALSITLNNLLASPSFHAWMEGDPLDIQKLLHTSDGKPKISIISIAHLSDSERMFFVTLLLNEFISWMRKQPGTTSLRALLYMDEIFGYFPPVSRPPSKIPMLTLLKQARAFGVGVALATQNPVDLDYKGLSNCGTWFIGKLQTQRDKARILEGLKVASQENLDASRLDKLLAMTKNRVFIAHSIYEKKPFLFETRWTLSYLRGPLTLKQIASLTEKPKHEAKKDPRAISQAKPLIPPDVPEYFVNVTHSKHYRPFIAGFAKLHFVNSKQKIDIWQDICLVVAPSSEGKIHWENGKNQPELQDHLEKEPEAMSTFEELPAELMQKKTYQGLTKTLESSLYQNQALHLYEAVDFKERSKPGEQEADFRLRIVLRAREKRDEAMQKLREQYASQITKITDKIRKAQEKVAAAEEKASAEKTDTLISFGTTVLDAILGSKGTLSKAGGAIKKAGRSRKSSQDIVRAQADVQSYQSQLDEIEAKLQQEMAKITINNPADIQIDTTTIRPRKSDISVNEIALVWLS